MHHFFDPLHVGVDLTTGGVVLAIRVADHKVDEHYLGLSLFREMAVAYQERDGEWAGPDMLQAKLDAKQKLVALAIGPRAVKREVYRFSQSHFEVMIAQFMAKDRG